MTNLERNAKAIKIIQDAYKLAEEEKCIGPFWDLITALRGPDNESDDVKVATTGVIRDKLFGIMAFCTSYPDTTCSYADRKNLKHSHFRSHAELAFDVLGLKWDAINLEERKDG